MSKVSPGGGGVKTAPPPISRAEQRRRNAAFFKLKPSDMINAIVDDLNAAERTKGIIIDMGVWVKRDYAASDGQRYGPMYVASYIPDIEKEKLRDVCAVCLAGSVMTQRLGVGPETMELGYEVTPDEVGASDRQITILEAIDSLRCGDICVFVEAVIGKKKTAALNLADHGLEYTFMRPYRTEYLAAQYNESPALAKKNRTLFKRKLRSIAKKLAKLGV